MTDHSADIAALQRFLDEVQRIRTRTCEPKSNTNPRYLALSNVVTNLRKAADDLEAEDQR